MTLYIESMLFFYPLFRKNEDSFHIFLYKSRSRDQGDLQMMKNVI